MKSEDRILSRGKINSFPLHLSSCSKYWRNVFDPADGFKSGIDAQCFVACRQVMYNSHLNVYVCTLTENLPAFLDVAKITNPL